MNLKHAWTFLFDSLDYPFDIRYMRHMNAIIEANLIRNAGTIRKIPVRISGKSWQPGIPSETSIEDELERLRKIKDPADRAMNLMLSIMCGQYFEDGNKRTAQLLANQELLRNGCGIISVPTERKEDSAGLLIGFCEIGEREEILDFLFSACLSGYERSPISRQQMKQTGKP